MKKDFIENYLDFEKKLLNNPKTFFSIFNEAFEGRCELIWKEFIEWQKSGGKINDFDMREIKDDIVVWKIGNESFAQKIHWDIDKEQYKKGLKAVYSFMEDRPQFYKFRKMEGMFNPLQLLLYRFIKKVAKNN